MKTNTYSINGFNIIAEYYTKDVNDSFIYLYDGYNKLNLKIIFTMECINASLFREFFANNKNNDKFNISLPIYDSEKNLLRKALVSGKDCLSKFGNIDALTDNQLNIKKVTMETSISLDDSTFIRGETFLTTIEIIDWINSSSEYITSINSNYSRNFIVNKFPEFKTDINNIQCYATYGPDKIRYTEDDGFINIFEFSNIPDIIKTNADASMISIYYSLKKSGQSSYSNWNELSKSTSNALNICEKDLSGNYKPLYISLNDFVNDLSSNDKVKFAIFSHTENEINLNSPNWISGEYFKKTPSSLPVPKISNIENNSEYPNIIISTGNSNIVSANISKEKEYLMYYEDIVVEIKDNLSSNWYPCNLSKIMVEGPLYDYVKDDEGNIKVNDDGTPEIKTDENGNPIVLVPAVYDYIYVCDKKYSDIGTYTLTPRVRIKNNGNVFTGSLITFTIFENILIYPVITYFTDDDSTVRELTEDGLKSAVPVYINYVDDNRFSTINIFELVHNIEDNTDNWVFLSRNQEITEFGKHLIKAEGIIARTGESSYITRTFTISSELPNPIEVTGVTDYDIAEFFKISVKKDDTSTLDIYYTKDGSENKIIPTLNRYTDENGIIWYTFNISTKGLYNLYIEATHNFSGLKRNKVINGFRVNKGEVSSNFIDFNPYKPPLHSTILSLYPTNVRNKLYYWIDDKTGEGTKYLSPLLITKNITAYGREISGSVSVDESKSFNGIVKYTPELPSIIDANDGAVYYTKRNIRFINNASKPNQAEYLIFLDGEKLENPFNNSYSITQSGYHYIFIIGWDNVRPFDYVYKEIKFLVKAEDSNSLRKPGIVFGKEDENGEVTILFDFSALHPDVTHTITISYGDGTNEKYTYPYNIGRVTLKVKKNCTIVATSKYNSTNMSQSNNITIDYIYEKEPDLTDIKILGLRKKLIHSQSFGDFNVNIGPLAWLNIPKSPNYDYSVYINGYPYELYSDIEDETDLTYGNDANFRPIIYNQDKELRKYRIEVIVKNRFFPEKESYYYNEFIIDSLEFAFPKLNSLRNNVMNRVGLPSEIHEKHEENVKYIEAILNNRITDVRTYLINKDDEYILTMTYEYYTGSKRTSSFRFSINSNALDELKPLRMVMKVKDFQDIPNYDYYIEKGLEPEAKDGEFIIDRQTGHLFFGSKNGTTKIDIVPITKDLELIANETEEYLLNCDEVFNRIDYLYYTCSDILVFYENRLYEFASKVDEYYLKLENICTEISRIKSNMDRIHEELESFEAEILNNTKYIGDTLSKSIEDDTNMYKELNDNFEILISETLRDDFSLASEIKDSSFYLKDEIAKKVTTKSFEEWKANEEDKYNRFVNSCKKFFGK